MLIWYFDQLYIGHKQCICLFKTLKKSNFDSENIKHNKTQYVIWIKCVFISLNIIKLNPC